MEEIKVSNEVYADPNTGVKTERGWEPAKPELWQGFHWKRISHLFGKHYSYGQLFCLFCGKKEI